jgi:hypothetical protein
VGDFRDRKALISQPHGELAALFDRHAPQAAHYVVAAAR